MYIASKRVLKTLPVLCLVAGSLFATAASAADYYSDFGGKAGMTVVTDKFVDRVLQDQRIAGYFAQADIPNLKEQLAIQFCMLLNGPCKYDGPSMQRVHQDMGVTQAAFNSLAEDLIYVMKQQHVPIAAQNALIKKLAPMEHAIVTQ
jgi:hemoglobin